MNYCNKFLLTKYSFLSIQNHQNQHQTVFRNEDEQVFREGQGSEAADEWLRRGLRCQTDISSGLVRKCKIMVEEYVKT